MNTANLLKVHEADRLSCMGGAANGGSAKTPQEREEARREFREPERGQVAGSDPDGDAPAGQDPGRMPEQDRSPDSGRS